MYTVLVASMDRQVVAVDADPENLAYIRKSLDLQNTTNRVRLFSNAVSDDYVKMFPYSPDRKNSGGTLMKTLEEVKVEKIKTIIVGISLFLFETKKIIILQICSHQYSQFG